MKKRIGIFLFILFTALALACAGAAADEDDTASFGEFSGDGMVNAELAGFSGEPFIFFEKPLYARSTLPDGLITFDAFDYIFLCPPGKRGDSEIPDAGELTFLSGDESLRDALCFSLTDRVRLGTGIAGTARPGEATFRLRLQAGKLYYEAEVVFRLLSWNEYPLFEFRNSDGSGMAEKGEGPELADSFGNVAGFYRSPANNTNLYTKDQAAALLIKDRSAEVMGRLLTEEQMQAVNEYKARESLYELYADQAEGSEDWYPQENLWNGINFSTNEEVFQFREEGEYRFSLYSNISNVQGSRQFTVHVLPYKLTGPSTLMPGETGVYSVMDEKPEEGRTFTLSAGGEGISFDAETRALAVAEDTPEGTWFTVTASPSDGKHAVSLEGKVSNGLISSEEFRLEPAWDGFRIPLPADTGKYEYESGACYTTDGTAPMYICISYNVDMLDEFTEDRKAAEKCYDSSTLSEKPDYQKEDVVLGDHQARIEICRDTYKGNDYSLGYLQYARNNRVARIAVYCMPINGTGWDELPKVTMGDMRKLAELIEYDPLQAPITVADGMISLSTKEGTDVVTAGKKLTVLAAFANPEKANKKAKNDKIEWSVSGEGGAEAPAGVSINGSGVLSAAKTDEVMKVEVTASSPVFHTSAGFTVTIIPAVKKISAEPAELWFYTGTEASAEVKAVLEPETVPPLGITWKESKQGIAEITADPDNGTAVIRPLAAGKITVQVKEPGGKNAKLTVNVVEPVTDMELAVNGNPKPGSTVTVKETILPKQAGNKAVEWALDVGEDIATISKGKVKIAKTAPEGTVITVTCTAIGAPEPIVKTVQFTVAK